MYECQYYVCNQMLGMLYSGHWYQYGKVCINKHKVPGEMLFSLNCLKSHTLIYYNKKIKIAYKSLTDQI